MGKIAYILCYIISRFLIGVFVSLVFASFLFNLTSLFYFSNNSMCLYPSWDNPNYRLTVMLISFTVGPAFIPFLALSIFSGTDEAEIFASLPAGLKWTLKAFSLAILTSLIIAVGLAISLLSVTASPVLLPDYFNEIQCPLKLKTYFTSRGLLFVIFPPFALFSSIFILLLSFFLWHRAEKLEMREYFNKATNLNSPAV